MSKRARLKLIKKEHQPKVGVVYSDSHGYLKVWTGDKWIALTNNSVGFNVGADFTDFVFEIARVNSDVNLKINKVHGDINSVSASRQNRSILLKPVKKKPPVYIPDVKFFSEIHMLSPFVNPNVEAVREHFANYGIDITDFSMTQWSKVDINVCIPENLLVFKTSSKLTSLQTHVYPVEWRCPVDVFL